MGDESASVLTIYLVEIPNIAIVFIQFDPIETLNKVLKRKRQWQKIQYPGKEETQVNAHRQM